MAPESFSSQSNTSHTLSADPPHLLSLNHNPPAHATLLSALSASPQDFLQPTPSLHSAALVLTKAYLDPVASSVSEIQTQRRRLDGHKRRKTNKDGDHDSILALSKLYLEGFEIDQVWDQARRVLAAAVGEVELGLTQEADVKVKKVAFEEAYDSEEEVPSEEPEEELEDHESEDEDQDEEAELDEDVEEDLEDIEDDDELGLDDEEVHHGKYDLGSSKFVADPNKLNDGFFSIDDFNRQTEYMERLDVDGDADEASDEEDVDWETDPLGSSARNRDDDSEEDGPTFADANLDSDEEDEDLEDNANDIYYQDFFAPPPRKGSYKDDHQPAPAELATEPGFDDVQRTMNAVRRDLFDDLSEASDDGLPELDPSDPRSRRSTHERRQAQIADEIRRLEAANVAKREWTLSGEAKASDRPLNSLLEEDLDFERTGKPVPVITAEVTESLEELIKRRIVAQDFDELIRRRPDGVGQEVRRGKIELDHSKPQQSLAEMYEEDHLKKIDPLNNPDKLDARIVKQREEVTELWSDIRRQLDSLTSWHYKPTVPTPSVNVIADVSTITMEDARPTAGGDVAGSMLAPQEVYKPGEAKTAGEVTLKSGAPVRMEEMSRDEKRRRRRREKERGRKRLDGSKPVSVRKEEKQGLIKDLKKGGVKVIGKKGELRDVEGKKIQEKSALRSAAGLKL